MEIVKKAFKTTKLKTADHLVQSLRNIATEFG
jgi:hypothetical protein